MNRKLLKFGFLQSLILVMFLWIQIDSAYAEPVKQWFQLTPMQQEALSPLAAQWDGLPAKLQNHLLLSTKQYPELSPEKKKRFLSRLEKWSKLTPEQRERARQKYIALRQLSNERREQFKQAAIEKEKNKAAAENNIQSSTQATLPSSAAQPVSTNHQ
jgi:hypothetical protein